MTHTETDDILKDTLDDYEKELEQLNESIANKNAEISTEKKQKQLNEHSLREAQKEYKEREQEYSSIEHRFFENTRVIRATDDDLSTIRDSFKQLKYSVSRLTMSLNKKADRTRAAEKFKENWPRLNIVSDTGELESSLVSVLTEKLVNEHLVKNVFNSALYPGLKVNEAYSALSSWLNEHASPFAIRLRQQMAAIIVRSNKDSDIMHDIQQEKNRIVDLIYNDLADIYSPFIRDNDKEDKDKGYRHKVCDIVDKALKLVIAMRGQEVDITTVPIQEGEQPYDEETMTDIKGRSSGIVRFSICPAFTGGDREHGFTEKGKVLLI